MDTIDDYVKKMIQKRKLNSYDLFMIPPKIVHASVTIVCDLISVIYRHIKAIRRLINFVVLYEIC